MSQVKSEKVLRYYNDYYRKRWLKKIEPSIVGWDYEYSRVHWALLTYLRDLKPEKTLEVGVGEGLFALKVSEQRRNMEMSYVGIDLSVEGVRIATEKIGKKDFYFLTADGLHLPFKSRQFDMVVCSEVVEHVTGKRSLLVEINRILKPHGHLILTTPNRISLMHIHTRIMNLVKRSEYGRQIIEEQLDPSELMKLLEETCFLLIDYKGFVFYFSAISWLEKLIKKPLLFVRCVSEYLEKSNIFRFLGLYQVVLARK